MIISYEIHENKSLASKMTMSLRFCLSHVAFSLGFIVLKGDIISTGVTVLRANSQVLHNVWSYDFYVMRLRPRITAS